MNPAGQLHSGIRPTPWPGSKVKKASSLPAHGDCLSATEQLQTCQEVSWERNRDAAEHRVTWNSIPPDPVCTIQENKPRSETRENGEPRRTHSHGRVDAFRFSRNTCCLATVLVGLTSKYQKAMLLWISEMDWKKKKKGEQCNRHYIGRELTSEMKGKAPMDPILPISFPVPQLLIDPLW